MSPLTTDGNLSQIAEDPQTGCFAAPSGHPSSPCVRAPQFGRPPVATIYVSGA
jgi:hypothetical protein